MIFAISHCDTTQRAILDDELHGDVICVIEARSWQEAREEALKQDAMNPYEYRDGFGWFREPVVAGDNK